MLAPGVFFAPVALQTSTVTVSAVETRPDQMNPVRGNVAGVAATVIAVVDPAILTVPVLHAPLARDEPPMLLVVPLRLALRTARPCIGLCLASPA